MLRHPQTYPEKGGETLAVVSHSKVVWLGSEDFHDVFIEFCLLDLEEENSQLVTTQMCIKGTFNSKRPQLRWDPSTRTNVPSAGVCIVMELSVILIVMAVTRYPVNHATCTSTFTCIVLMTIPWNCISVLQIKKWYLTAQPGSTELNPASCSEPPAASSLHSHWKCVCDGLWMDKCFRI